MDEAYEGREQTFIKHQFLTKYLQHSAFKIFQGRSPIFNYVDAFAGPWRIEDDENYSDSSFDQALRTLNAVKSSLAEKGIANLKIRSCFCERRPEAVDRLREYAARHHDYEIHVFSGMFEDNLDKIASVLPDGFTFTFIDPTGWNIRSREVFNFLRDRDGEFLLNFMSDHINRHTGYEAVAESFGRFLANEDWSDQFANLPNELSNESKVLILLKRQMQKDKVAKYFPDFSIMLPRQERLKMRLVFGTNSIKGLQLFRDVEEKIEKQETQIRLDLRVKDTGQGSLFSTEDHVEFEQERKGVGCKKYRDIAQGLIKLVLEQHESVTYSKLWPYLLSQVPLREPHVKQVLKDMKERGIIDYELPKRKLVPQPDTVISLVSDQLRTEDLIA